MGKVYDRINDDLQAFIRAQHMFFVATAPLSAAGHVNVSPKGLDSLRVLDDRTVAYLDHIGSGAETIAHVRENGRITLMFCAFTGSPKIVRLHGYGRIFEPGDQTFTEMRGLFPQAPGVRSIVRVDVERVSGSCGFGVPLFRHEGDRRHLLDWADRKGEQGLLTYQRDKNHVSIDGLPALRWTEDVTV
ncbi:MAG: pyridoxamine 5'-phosphate oxidase family protein [Vicinamibacterales bacterium]